VVARDVGDRSRLPTFDLGCAGIHRAHSHGYGVPLTTRSLSDLATHSSVRSACSVATGIEHHYSSQTWKVLPREVRLPAMQPEGGVVPAGDLFGQQYAWQLGRVPALGPPSAQRDHTIECLPRRTSCGSAQPPAISRPNAAVNALNH
jgi:hypothetical protein